MTSWAVAQMNNLTMLEKLTIAQATQNVIGDVVSTKNPDSLRSQLDADVLEDFQTSGIKSRDVRLGDTKVGTYSIRTKKAHAKDVPVLKDISAYNAWMEENAEYAIAFAYSSQDFVQWVINQGELPDGYELNHVEIPEQATGTTLKVDVQKVAQAMGNELPSVVAGLLEGSN